MISNHLPHAQRLLVRVSKCWPTYLTSNLKLTVMKRYVTLLIICLPFLVGAQQLPGGLKGTVKDEITKESIPFASVRVLLGDELVAGASTDFDGNYIIAPLDHGKYTVTFENSSYTKRRISVAINPGKVKVLNIEMSVEEQVLDEIVLTDHKLIEVGKTSTIMRSESTKVRY